MIIVALLLQIINLVGLLDWFRDLESIREKKFINKFYLVLHIYF